MISSFGLPIVRTRRLPPAAGALHWRESGDIPATIVVSVVAVIGILLGVGAIKQAASAAAGMDSALLTAALVLLLPGVVALLAAIAELTRVHTVSIDDAAVHLGIRALGRRVEHSEPLHQYRGLLILDRTRRLFIRNQDRPITGRRGPVTEFVIVLRHRESRSRDVELFRAQPSLETLLTMYSMQDAASGRASAANAGACAELAASYRHAVARLCGQLDKPVLIADADHVLHEWPVQILDEWLQPPSSQQATTSGIEQ